MVNLKSKRLAVSHGRDIAESLNDDRKLICTTTSEDELQFSESIDLDHSDSSSQIINQETEPETAEKESIEVKRVRIIVFLVVLLSVLGAVAVYFYHDYFAKTQFKTNYYDHANKVLEALGDSLRRSLGAQDSLATTIVSIANYSNQSFPFVTIPDYGIHVTKIIPQTGALGTYMLPVIQFQQRREWESYAAKNNSKLGSWVNRTLQYQDNWDHFYGPMPQNRSWMSHDVIHGDFGDIPYDEDRPGRLDVLLPEWHKFPLIMTSYNPANWDWYSIQYPEAMTKSMTTRKAVLSQPMMIPRPDNPVAIKESQAWCVYYEDFIEPEDECMEPMSQFYYPIIESRDFVSFTDDKEYPEGYDVKALIVSEFYWKSLLQNTLPKGSKSILIVFQNACIPDVFTYQISGPEITYLGVGDFHNEKYRDMSVSSTLSELLLCNSEEKCKYYGVPLDQDFCEFSFRTYPMHDSHSGSNPNIGLIFSLSATAFILLPFLLFMIYDRTVARQRRIMVSHAKKTNAIVSSLYPSTFRDRLYQLELHNRKNLKVSGNPLNSQPIAELYPETTILFADITGFTAWSSVRDPYQVFTLLETLYGAFDEVAQSRRIFKVETVGDCYVAASGLPEARKDHAVAMVKFACDILGQMYRVTTELSTVLGPGTSSLTLRVGLNSGPTTAGVLRGSKGRFQLFGDTVNTAARMESNSSGGCILCSEKTASLLIVAGKAHWLTPTTELVDVKGKGKLQCFWILQNVSTSQTFLSVDDKLISKEKELSSDSVNTLIDWATKLLEDLLNEIVTNPPYGSHEFCPNGWSTKCSSPREEVSETIALPQQNIKPKTKSYKQRFGVNEKVKIQLRKFVSIIASKYRDNQFHNFEHACHVMMATKKLLSRVIEPNEYSVSSTAYGITSDPLTHFAIVFSALVHDVDHPGVSNAELAKELSPTGLRYQNKSIAEQNSISIAWDLLSSDEFVHLRNAIAANDSDCKRFRQILVNLVMATDLFDRELKALRENRWHKAFYPNENDQELVVNNTCLEDCNRRATIVIEHIIQAADVSHTMQHWHVYQTWNKRLFTEMYNAYISGRSEKNPADGWCEGELWFFDNYVIPLAKKLKTCGVFGVSCDELLTYATENRSEWAMKGKEIVAMFMAENAENVNGYIQSSSKMSESCKEGLATTMPQETDLDCVSW